MILNFLSLDALKNIYNEYIKWLKSNLANLL